MDLLGLITFSNVVFALSISMIVMGSVWLFGIHFLAIITLIPLHILELLLYGGLTYCINRAPDWFGELAYVWGFLFACGLSATTFLTMVRANINFSVFNLVNVIIHGVVGVYLQSTMISFMAVVFFMALIGFNFALGQGFISLGYEEIDIIPSATFASGVVTLLGCYFKQHPFNHVSLFVPGMLWLGPLVFYVSLLIMSSSLYHGSKNGPYVNMNLITVIAGVCALFFGNVYSISQLAGIGGTFFTIFLLEKYYELMPNRVETWAWSTLLLGIVLYTVNIHYRTEIENYGLYEYFHLLPPIEG